MRETPSTFKSSPKFEKFENYKTRKPEKKLEKRKKLSKQDNQKDAQDEIEQVGRFAPPCSRERLLLPPSPPSVCRCCCCSPLVLARQRRRHWTCCSCCCSSNSRWQPTARWRPWARMRPWLWPQMFLFLLLLRSRVFKWKQKRWWLARDDQPPSPSPLLHSQDNMGGFHPPYIHSKGGKNPIFSRPIDALGFWFWCKKPDFFE